MTATMSDIKPAFEKAARLFGTDKPLFAESAGLFIFAAALPFSVSLLQGGMLLFMAAALWRRREQGNLAGLPAELRDNPLFIPWALYLAAGFLAAVFGVNVPRSLAALNSDVFKIASFAALCLFLKRERRETAVKFYLAGLAATALLGICQSAASGFTERAHGTSHHVRFGEIMVIGLALSLSGLAFPETTSARTKKTFYAIGLLTIAAITLSQTRGAYLGAAIMFASFFIARRPPKRTILPFLAAAAGLVFGLSLLNAAIRNKTFSIFLGANSMVNSAAASPDQSVSTRLELWKTGLTIISDRPVFGTGPANVKELFPVYYKKAYPENILWGSLHNIYIHQGAERGLTGLAALLFLFCMMFLTALRGFRAAPSTMTLWALSILPAWFVMNLTEISFQHVNTSYAVMLALALSITASREK